MSLLQVFMPEFGIHHVRTSTYHPETDGNLERFHRVLKDMLNSMAENYSDKWGEFLPWILFPYR